MSNARNEREVKAAAIERVLELCKIDHPSVVVLAGSDQEEWVKAYSKANVGQVQVMSFSILKEFSVSSERDKSNLIIHVTEGVPAESLDAAQKSVQTLANSSNLIVFTPKPLGDQRPEELLVSWPSFWAVLFLSEEMILHDAIRPLIWNCFSQDWERLQSTVVFARKGVFDSKSVENIGGLISKQLVDYVHPRFLEHFISEVGGGSAIENEQISDFSSYLAAPKRYSKEDYCQKIVHDRREWWKVAIIFPWRITYWQDLWRYQRRLKRKVKSV